MDSNTRDMIICFVISIGLIIFLIHDQLENPELTKMLILMPFFIFTMLFAVFGKDLFKRQKKATGEQK